jgi:ribosomal protein S18 acetylase RimI-like enzyme
MARIERVDSAGREEVLARVLAPQRRSALATAAQVRSFAHYIETRGLEWVAWRCWRQRHETACLFVLLLPGRTAIVMFPPFAARSGGSDDQRQLLAAGLEDLAGRELHYVQALVEPQAADKRELLKACGFTHLTQLIYLRRPVSAGRERVNGLEATWRAYDAESHSAFAQVLLATYEDSRDCPELTDLRPIDAVIASHKAAGEFDPALWEIACVAGERAGCILLAPAMHEPLMEVVYLGVVPGWRRRGAGKLLLRRALEQCGRVGIPQLAAVVDRRNDPARQLYAGFEFKPTAAREAYIRTW